MEALMREKVRAVAAEYERLGAALGTPEVVSNQDSLRKHAKAHRDLEATVRCFERFENLERELEGTEQLLHDESDPDIVAMAQEDRERLRAGIIATEEELKVLLIPKDPNDDKNTIVEIRAGTGGDEAALFVADLFRMYSRVCERRNWRIDVMNSNATELGGYKEISFQVTGDHVYSLMKWEGGVHRVQRVPDTEAQGRIHTSAVTVAVLPEAEEVDIHIDPNDLQIDVYRSSGPGGQSVNTTDSAVRVTHKPTGVVVTCQDEKSQHKNKAKAIKVLRARLLDAKQQEEDNARSAERKNQVGSGDRSERIRTYNFPQNRLSDHRINLTIYSLDRVMEGELDGVFEALVAADRAAKLSQPL